MRRTSDPAKNGPAKNDPATDAADRATPIPYPRDSPGRVATPPHRARRQWLKAALGTALAGVLTYLGWTRYLFPPPPAAPGPDAGAGRIKLGPISRFPAGGPPHLVVLPSGSYIVENRGGGFRVLSGQCTHQGCTVGWNAARRQFVCPCHAGRFDLTGRNVWGPPRRPLPVLPSHVQDGTLYVV